MEREPPLLVLLLIDPPPLDPPPPLLFLFLNDPPPLSAAPLLVLIRPSVLLLVNTRSEMVPVIAVAEVGVLSKVRSFVLPRPLMLSILLLLPGPPGPARRVPR